METPSRMTVPLLVGVLAVVPMGPGVTAGVPGPGRALSGAAATAHPTAAVARESSVARYTLTDLGQLAYCELDSSALTGHSDEEESVIAMNASAQAVGAMPDPHDDSRVQAFRWDPAGGLRRLGALPGGRQSCAWGINDKGQVVGGAEAAGREVHAFLWEQRAGMRDLGTLGGQSSFASSVNERGQVIGGSYTGDGPTLHRHAFLWDSKTGMRDLGTLGGDSAYASAVNEQGQVVGYAETATGAEHAFRWDPAAGMRDLGVLPGRTGSRASAINDKGQVVGSSTTSDGRDTAFLWDPRSGTRSLGTPRGYRDSRATAIDEQGWVLGMTEPAKGYSWSSFLWRPGVGTRALNGGVAVRTTEDGQVLGGQEAYEGLLHAVRWDLRARRSDLGPLPAIVDPEEEGWQTLEGANDRGQFIGRLAAEGDDESLGHLALWSPIVSVRAKAVSGRSRLRVNVNPNRGPESWTITIQKRRGNGTWRRLKPTYQTEGPHETRTVNLPKGTYRVVVASQSGYRRAKSSMVQLRR